MAEATEAKEEVKVGAGLAIDLLCMLHTFSPASLCSLPLCSGQARLLEQAQASLDSQA
jgi:hypothetical protein